MSKQMYTKMSTPTILHTGIVKIGKVKRRDTNLKLIGHIKKNLNEVSITDFSKYMGKHRTTIYKTINRNRASSINTDLLIEMATKLEKFKTSIETSTAKKIKSIIK